MGAGKDVHIHARCLLLNNRVLRLYGWCRIYCMGIVCLWMSSVFLGFVC